MRRTLIQNADWVITMDKERNRIRGGDLLVEGREIRAVGKNLASRLECDEVIDVSGMVVDTRDGEYPSSLLAVSCAEYSCCQWFNIGTLACGGL